MIQLLPPDEKHLQDGASRWLKFTSFASDATLDMIVHNARASAAAAAARRILWLKQWLVDTHSKVVIAPLSGWHAVRGTTGQNTGGDQGQKESPPSYG